MKIEYRPAQHLMFVRWEAAGLEEDFPHEDREFMLAAEQQQCWRWLLDYRVHGDTTTHNAQDLFTTRSYPIRGAALPRVFGPG